MVSKNDSCTKFTEGMSCSWYQVINRAFPPVISFLLIRVIIQLMILLLAAMIRYLQRQVHQKTRWIWSKKFLIPKSTFLIGMTFSRLQIYLKVVKLSFVESGIFHVSIAQTLTGYIVV